MLKALFLEKRNVNLARVFQDVISLDLKSLLCYTKAS